MGETKQRDYEINVELQKRRGTLKDQQQNLKRCIDDLMHSDIALEQAGAKAANILAQQFYAHFNKSYFQIYENNTKNPDTVRIWLALKKLDVKPEITGYPELHYAFGVISDTDTQHKDYKVFQDDAHSVLKYKLRVDLNTFIQEDASLSLQQKNLMLKQPIEPTIKGIMDGPYQEGLLEIYHFYSKPKKVVPTAIYGWVRLTKIHEDYVTTLHDSKQR